MLERKMCRIHFSPYLDDREHKGMSTRSLTSVNSRKRGVSSYQKVSQKDPRNCRLCLHRRARSQHRLVPMSTQGLASVEPRCIELRPLQYRSLWPADVDDWFDMLVSSSCSELTLTIISPTEARSPTPFRHLDSACQRRQGTTIWSDTNFLA